MLRISKNAKNFKKCWESQKIALNIKKCWEIQILLRIIKNAENFKIADNFKNCWEFQNCWEFLYLRISKIAEIFNEHCRELLRNADNV